MKSRDEIIKGIIHHKLREKSMQELNHDECFDCPYRPIDMKTCSTIDALLDDVLTLFMEQEPVVPITGGQDDYECPSCGETIGWERQDDGEEPVRYKYCPECGKPIDWKKIKG